jgi:hypothetical protein
MMGAAQQSLFLYRLKETREDDRGSAFWSPRILLLRTDRFSKMDYLTHHPNNCHK